MCAQEKATAPRNPENQSMCCIAGGISPAVAGCCSSGAARGDSRARSSRFSSPSGSPSASSVARDWEKEFDRRRACSLRRRLLICRDLRGNQHLRRVPAINALVDFPHRWAQCKPPPPGPLQIARRILKAFDLKRRLREAAPRIGGVVDRYLASWLPDLPTLIARILRLIRLLVALRCVRWLRLAQCGFRAVQVVRSRMRRASARSSQCWRILHWWWFLTCL